MTFDWTSFAFQLINVLILLAILHHFLFRPVAEVITRRQATTDAALKAAEDAKAEAEAARAKADAEAKANADARQQVLAKARTDAEERRQGLLDKARLDAARIVADGETALDHRSADAQAQALDRARDLAETIARRALAAQPFGPHGYAERLTRSLAGMGPAERDALLKGDGLRLVAPSALDDDALKAAQAALAPYGASPQVDIDPALIAGLELRSANGVIRNSLAHDLDTIAEAMRDERAA